MHQSSNQLVRIAQRDKTATQVMAKNARGAFVRVQKSTVSPDDDYTQVDLDLALTDGPVVAPAQGVGYAGFTPSQRGHFLTWLDEPTIAAPSAFQHLYLANLEVNLLEGDARAEQTYNELHELHQAPAWRTHEGLARTTLLAYWLAKDGIALSGWIATGAVPHTLLGTALGIQALLGASLRREEMVVVLDAWHVAASPITPHSLDMRLRSLATTLQAEPLAYALEQLGEEEVQPRLWRCHHRDLRLLLPQPNIQPTLEPLLVEMMAVNEVVEDESDILSGDAKEATPSKEDDPWRLILEFGHSRSEFFNFALGIAQRMPTFIQLMDENRKLVYRVTFKKQEMRQFWRLWDYIQGWSTVQVYLNGQELDRWKIYPYSQFLR